MKLTSLLFLLCLGLPFLSCERVVTQDPIRRDIHGLWRYQSGIEWTPLDNDTEHNPLAYVRLNEGGAMRGFTSRNVLIGNFRFDLAGNIDLDITLTTKVADTPFSGRFTEVLEQVKQYRLDENGLVLIDTESGKEYVFLRMSPPTCRPADNNRYLFQNAETDSFDLLDVNVLGSCLELHIGYAGGCRDDIALHLVGSGDYAESLPPQLAVRLIVDDNDDCEAYIRRNYYFDLSRLQYEGLDELLLNIEGWQHSVLVNYAE